MFKHGLATAMFMMLAFACGPSETSRVSSVAPHDSKSSNLNEIAARFAPVIHLHPQELYFPMDPEAFLVRSESTRNEDFYRSTRRDFREGKQGRTVVNISEDGRQIQYWLFYAKNGCQGGKVRFRVQGPIKLGNIGEMTKTLELCNIAIHEGDWENVTLRLNSDLSAVESVYLSSHGLGNWLPASAIDFRNGRPYVYSALNSHAFYARDIGFHADTTISHDMLDGVLGVEWFQIGDVISEPTVTQAQPQDTVTLNEFDTQKSLVLYDEISNSALKNYPSLWGRLVDAKEVKDIPEFASGPIEWILKAALKVALQFAPELKNLSNGEAPSGPWTRYDWASFDASKGNGKSGISFDKAMGGTGGHAFTDYDKLKKVSEYQVNEISIRSGDRIDLVCIKVSNVPDLCHGGSGGNEHRLELSLGEYVVEQAMAFGEKDSDVRVFGIRFTTNLGRVLQGGTWTSDSVVQKAPSGMQLVGWFGTNGDEIDSLGPLYGTVNE
ncbi:MAG: DUF946 domain-containing protein [Proteobacteria bacterium]|nr:MAG: DUF946 domain-containing protein [Pseudomonadota bacterium]